MAPSFADEARALVQCCEKDFDSVIELLVNLQLEPAQDSNGAVATAADQLAAPVPAQTAGAAAENLLQIPSGTTTTSNAEWVEMLVGEMASAASMDDAKSRAAMVLGAFEASVGSRAGQVLAHKDRQLQAVALQNGILKRAVAVQHRRHVEHEAKSKELQKLVAQYKEQVRSLEVDNYALSMHLRQAGPGSSLPGSFHPEIF